MAQYTPTLRYLPTPKVKKSSVFRPDIQGLRAFAVVAVVLDHLIGWPKGGFVGVDAFFVLSGFLITGLLLREFEANGTISFRGFYRRRVKRILPAATLVLLASLTASYLVFNQGRFTTTLWDSVWAMFFASNWRSAIAGTDYFQAHGPVSPLQHYWSLAVEEQFYFVWPLLMLAAIMGAIRATGQQARPRVAAGVAISVLSALSFCWAMWETQNNTGVAYFSTFSRAWELGLGAILAVVSPVLSKIPAILRPALAWAGLVAMLAAVFLTEESKNFPAPAALLPVLGTCLVVAAGTGALDHRLLAPLTNRATRYLGDISYSLYLWHFPVIIIGSQLVDPATPLGQLILVAAFTMLAVYSYHLVEDPIRKSSWLDPKTRNVQSRQGGSHAYKMTALSALALITAAVVVPQFIPRPAPSASLPIEVAPAAKATKSAAPALPPKLAALQAELSNALRADTWPALSPSIDSVVAGGEAPQDIAACGMEAKLVNPTSCTWGDPAATKTAVVVGDSMALTYVETLRQALGNDKGWRVKSYGTFACAFADERSLGIDTSDACESRDSDAVKAIVEMHPDIVFVAHHYLERKPVGSTTGISSAQWQSALKLSLDKIQPSTGKIAFLPPPPTDKDIKACFTKTSRPRDCVTRPPSHWYEVADSERSLAKTIGAVHIDTMKWFCVDDLCPSFAGAVPVKMDWAHMSPAYQTKMGEIAIEQLGTNGLL